MAAALPDPDDHADLRAALERDAARLSEAPFDAALHAATMRRVRALAVQNTDKLESRWGSVLKAGLVLLVLGAVGVLGHLERPLPTTTRAKGGRPLAVAPFMPTRGSFLAYERAMAQGDEAVAAMLDRDAATPSLLSAPTSAGRVNSSAVRWFEED